MRRLCLFGIDCRKSLTGEDAKKHQSTYTLVAVMALLALALLAAAMSTAGERSMAV